VIEVCGGVVLGFAVLHCVFCVCVWFFVGLLVLVFDDVVCWLCLWHVFVVGGVVVVLLSGMYVCVCVCLRVCVRVCVWDLLV